VVGDIPHTQANVQFIDDGIHDGSIHEKVLSRNLGATLSIAQTAREGKADISRVHDRKW